MSENEIRMRDMAEGDEPLSGVTEIREFVDKSPLYKDYVDQIERMLVNRRDSLEAVSDPLLAAELRGGCRELRGMQKFFLQLYNEAEGIVIDKEEKEKEEQGTNG